MQQWECHAKQPSLRAPYSYFKWNILTFTRWNWNCHVIIVIKTDLSGFVATMHSCLCKQYVKSQPICREIWLPVLHVPSCIVTTNHSRTGLNPLIMAWLNNYIHCVLWVVTTHSCPTFQGSLTHWGWDKMAAISQTTLSNAFSWMKMLEFRLKLHCSLFPRAQLTIFQQWFR